jgi:DNA-binding SARP family transcriptional activator
LVTIRLLGVPRLERDGRPVAGPRGRKAWALLAYLLLAGRPPSRARLAELLFGEAADPLGALRWTLAELRRALGLPGTLGGDPVDPALGADVTVDVLLGAIDDPRMDGELLEGLRVESCPEFDAWLAVERRRVAAVAEARLRQAALALLTSGRAGAAVPYATRAVALAPLEQGNHELLVRSLAASGDRRAAAGHVEACADLFRRELGVEVSAALRDAADARPGALGVPAMGGRSAAASQIEAGRAAIAAGAVDAGLQCLRRAVAEAERCTDAALRGRALVALGGALVHAVRGRDEEGAVVLHEAIQVATGAGDRVSAVTAYRELGFVEVQAGRRGTADGWLAKAHQLAETDGELAAVLGVRGMSSSDHADYPTALGHLHESVERARSCGDDRQQAWSLSLVARAHLLRGDRSQATVAVQRSLELVHEQRWIAFLPWPQALRAELDLQAGDVERAAEGLEQAWAMAVQLGDPCWEGMAARGLGLLYGGRGDHVAAIGWLTEAADRCNRTPDRYQWIRAHVLDTAIIAALDRDDADRARPLLAALRTLSARCDLRELVVRAALHSARLGDPVALNSARLLAADIDNTELHRLINDLVERP